MNDPKLREGGRRERGGWEMMGEGGGSWEREE